MQTAFAPHVTESPSAYFHTPWCLSVFRVCFSFLFFFSLKNCYIKYIYQIMPRVWQRWYLGEWRQYVSVFWCFCLTVFGNPVRSFCCKAMTSCHACVMTLSDWLRQMHSHRPSQWEVFCFVSSACVQCIDSVFPSQLISIVWCKKTNWTAPVNVVIIKYCSMAPVKAVNCPSKDIRQN